MIFVFIIVSVFVACGMCFFYHVGIFIGLCLDKIEERCINKIEPENEDQELECISIE